MVLIGPQSTGPSLTVMSAWTVVRFLIALGAPCCCSGSAWRSSAACARPVPEPPPAGELRKVRLTYRCSICGTEVRMTAATTRPEPPRHCQEDMDLVSPGRTISERALSQRPQAVDNAGGRHRDVTSSDITFGAHHDTGTNPWTIVSGTGWR